MHMHLHMHMHMHMHLHLHLHLHSHLHSHSTMCHCEFPPRLVAGLAVTQGTESVCLGRLKRAVVHYMIKRSSCVFNRQMS